MPQGPGAGTDVIARLIADGVTQRLGQPVVVENMPAASGLLAHQTAARAAPDGTTFLFSTVSGLAINPVTVKSLPYDPARDFTPVAMVVDFAPQMLSVNAELPVKSVPEFIAYAKANPGKLSYAIDITRDAPRRCPRGSSTSAPASTWSRCPTVRRRRWRPMSAAGAYR